MDKLLAEFGPIGVSPEFGQVLQIRQLAHHHTSRRCLVKSGPNLPEIGPSSGCIRIIWTALVPERGFGPGLPIVRGGGGVASACCETRSCPPPPDAVIKAVVARAAVRYAMSQVMHRCAAAHRRMLRSDHLATSLVSVFELLQADDGAAAYAGREMSRTQSMGRRCDLGSKGGWVQGGLSPVVSIESTHVYALCLHGQACATLGNAGGAGLGNSGGGRSGGPPVPPSEGRPEFSSGICEPGARAWTEVGASDQLGALKHRRPREHRHRWCQCSSKCEP